MSYFSGNQILNYRGILNVVISNVGIFPNITKYYIEFNIYITSDYKTFGIRIELGLSFCKKHGKRISMFDFEVK